MAAATREGAAGEEADVVNPIVFFDITLGGESLVVDNPPNFLLLSSFGGRCVCVCVCVFYLNKSH